MVFVLLSKVFIFKILTVTALAPGSVPVYVGLVMNKWHWDRFFSEYVGFSQLCHSTDA